MANPILNDKKLEEARAGWAAPQAPSRGGDVWAPPGEIAAPPLSDGPVTPWRAGMMTVNGAITASAVLFTLLLASAVVGWIVAAPEQLPDGTDRVQFPAIAIVGVIVGFVAVIAVYFKPKLAKILGPVYAIAEGFFVGAISRAYETYYDGIVVQAAGATLAVVAVMLVLYRTGVVRVTPRFRKIVIGATLGVMVLYLVSMVMNIFGNGISFIREPSALGIAFSIFVCALAAANLALDFDFIEKGSKMGLSKDYEWVAAVGLLVTVVWLYLEILRLLAKLRD